MTPDRRTELAAMALDALHRSCPTTPRADYLDPGVARAIAIAYLELALMPSALWDEATAASPAASPASPADPGVAS